MRVWGGNYSAVTTVSVGKGPLYKEKCYDDRAVNASCRHASPSVFVSIDGEERVPGEVFGSWIIWLLKNVILQNWAWKAGRGKKFPVKLLFFFFAFFSILFPIDRGELFSNSCSCLPTSTPGREPNVTETGSGFVFCLLGVFCLFSGFVFFPFFFCCCCQGSFPLMSEQCREEGERGGGVQTRCANTYRTTDLNTL